MYKLYGLGSQERPIPDTSEAAVLPFAAASARGAGRLAHQAYDALRTAGQEGQLEPGRRVLELDLCSWLNVSRTPIGEAAIGGHASRRAGRRPLGGAARLASVSELYDLQERLEGTAAVLAACNADAAGIHLLEAVIARHHELPDEPAVHARENNAFHEHIHRAAHNRFLLRSLQDLHTPWRCRPNHVRRPRPHRRGLGRA